MITVDKSLNYFPTVNMFSLSAERLRTRQSPDIHVITEHVIRVVKSCHVRTDSGVDSLLDITLESKVNKTQENDNQTPLVLSVVAESTYIYLHT